MVSRYKSRRDYVETPRSYLRKFTVKYGVWDGRTFRTMIADMRHKCGPRPSSFSPVRCEDLSVARHMAYLNNCNLFVKIKSVGA